MCTVCRQASPGSSTGLRINQPGDQFEREADRAADVAVGANGGLGLAGALSSSKLGIQRQDASAGSGKPKSEEDKYKEAAKKTGEALLETETGKKIKEKAEAIATSLPGLAILGSAAVGIVTKAAIKNEELPIQPPDIPLDKVGLPGMKMKLTYEGPVRSPKKAMITFSGTFGGGSKKGKPKQTRSEKQRAENARIAAEQRQFRESMKTPEQKQADQDAVSAYVASQMLNPASRLYIPGLAPLPRALPLNPREAQQRRDDDGSVQRSSTGRGASVAGAIAPSIVYGPLRSSGQPLDGRVRGAMESKFGTDFSGVRVHTSGQAAQASKSIEAKAYTVGNDIVFGSGQYSPHTYAGQKLIAHELAHVVQQSGHAAKAMPKPSTALKRPIPSEDDPLEREAHYAATRVAAGGRPSIRHRGVGVFPMRHPVYISRHGTRGFLDLANDFYTRWGYSPIMTDVDSIEEIVADLQKKSSIGRVTIVTHAHPTNLFISFLDGGRQQVSKDDWRADMIDDDAEGTDARHRQDLSELTQLEDHYLSSATVNSVIHSLSWDDEHQRRLDRIGPSADPLVRQFIWWATEWAWVRRARFNRGQTRRLRTSIQGHMDQYRDSILLAYAAGAVGSTGTPPPVERDFDQLRDAIEAVVREMDFERLTGRERRQVYGRLRSSRPEQINRVIRNPQFARDVESVRSKVSTSTWFEIQGCRAGQDRGYLQAMQQFFRNGETLPKVTAPDWFQVFGWYGYRPTRTRDRDISRQWRRRQVRDALAYWYPIIVGGVVPDPLTEDDLRSYLQAPHVLPLSIPGGRGRPSDFLVDVGMREGAFLDWYARHSYRLTDEQDIDNTLFTTNQVDTNVRRTIVDWLQENRRGRTQMVFRPDPAYQQHIIEA